MNDFSEYPYNSRFQFFENLVHLSIGHDKGGTHNDRLTKRTADQPMIGAGVYDTRSGVAAATLERDCNVFNQRKRGLSAFHNVPLSIIASLRIFGATLSLIKQVPETQTDGRNTRTHIPVGN